MEKWTRKWNFGLILAISSISVAIFRPFQAWGHFPFSFPFFRDFCSGPVSHSVKWPLQSQKPEQIQYLNSHQGHTHTHTHTCLSLLGCPTVVVRSSVLPHFLVTVFLVFGHFLVTFSSFSVTFLPNPFCLPPFAARRGLPLRQGDPSWHSVDSPWFPDLPFLGSLASAAFKAPTRQCRWVKKFSIKTFRRSYRALPAGPTLPDPTPSKPLATGKYGCRKVRVYPTECGEQLGRDPKKIWELQISYFEEFSGVERTFWDLSLLVSLTLWDTPVLFTPPLPLS